MKRKILLLSVVIFLLIAPITIKADYTCAACLADATDRGAAAYESCMNNIGDDALCQQQMWVVACNAAVGGCSPCTGTVELCSHVGGRGPILP
jgi:hypothetical protein